MTELCTFQSNDAQYTNFIRNSIKNFYKCPKCRSQFSVKRNNETNKRLRPYILPCKHTVCESCIIKNIRCFECPVCLKPVLFPKFRINIREYIELDFYLLGYLYYFDLLDENKEAIVLREISQKAIAPKPTQKCSECERQAAYGKCLHCKAFFCTSCFTQVHATSKVLRSHRLDRITSDEFNLYVPNRCYAHHNVINYICITCDEELCKTCRRLTDHEDHDVKRIFEENQLHQDDITHMLESLKRFDEVLAKSEKDIRRFETQIKKYMADVAEQVTEHYSKLHINLQMEQQAVMKQFNEFWEVPHDGLVNMKNNLKNSKTATNFMRTNLEFLCKNTPSDRSIDGLLKKYSTYLETLPCKAQNMKFESNPVTFEPTFTNAIDFGSTCSIAVKKPTTEFAMGSLYSYNFEILDFDINYPTQSELSLSSLDKMNIVKSSKILKKKRTPVKEKIPSYTILKKKTFDSNETIENFHEILSLPSADNPMGCVTFIKSPAMFYIQLKEHKPLIQQISNAYKSHSVDLSINNEFNDINTDVEVDSEIETTIEFEIEIDKLYIIHYTDSEYYRGLVKNVCINRVYNVYLVDLGLTVDVEVKSFRTIKQEHINIPYVAICCSMYNLVPKQGSEWDKDATMLFTQLTSNEVIVELNKNQSKITTGEWSVNIIALYQDNSYSMRDVLLYTGFAMEVSENGTTNHLAFARQEHCFQKRMLLNNQFVVCRICSIENPLEFYAMQEDLIKEKNDLNKSLNELYSEEEVLKTVFVGYIHMCCATQVDGVWYRARIVRINAGGVIDIFLVDEGKTITTKWNQLYELLKEFVKIKEFIFQCELLGVKPSQKNNYQWTNEALTEFKHLVQNPRVVIYINTKNSLNVYKVNLNVTKTSGDIDVAAELIKSGLCDPSGEYCDITNSGTKKQSDMIINSDNNFRMEMIETQTQIKYDEQNKNSIIRTPIEIVEIINPFEFYVYVKQLLPGIINFLYKLSSIDYFRPQKDLIWKENDHCIVKANVYVECVQQLIDERCDQKDYNFIYHRGIIMFCDTEHSIYDIFLRDYGKIIRNVEKSNIYIIPLADDNVSDSAQRCHLAAIQPINERKSWSKTAIDFFTRVVTNPSNELSATLYGTPDKSNNSLPIILWITSTDNNDALAPNQQNHAKLNSALVKMGHACCLKWVDFKDNILGTEWVIDKKDIIDDSLRKIFKTIEKQSTPDDNFLNTYASEHKSPKSLDSDNTYASNLIDLTPTKPTMLSPYFWRQRKLIQETYFEGNPTYIDYDGIIYMHKSIDKTQLHRMRLKLDKYFARYSNEMSFLMTDFGINQACIAKYSADNHTYRAIITAINQNEFKVLFIDYGNEEMVTLKDILPFAPYANIQAYADTYKLIGIGPKKGTKYSERVLDIIHKQIVGKSVMVRVSPSALTNKGRDYTWCSICDQATDLASMLLINRLVVLVKEENEPSNKMDTEILPLMSDDHNDDDDDCLVRCLRDIDDVSPIKEMSDLDDEYGNATSDFLNQNNNFDDLAQKFATSLDLLNTNHEDGEPTNEIDCTFLNNPPPPKKPMFTRNEYMKLKSDFDRNHILDAKNIIKKATNAESTLISKHHTEGFSNMCKEHLSISSDNLAEDNAENMPINTTITANDLERDISPFERFSPSKTSTVRTHSMLNIFTFPKLKKFRTSFKCTIIHIVQPDILYVVPTATEYEDLSLELDSLINAIAPKLNPLQNFNNNTPCLVQYAKDNRWYRAAIKNYNKRTNIATVTYADYLSVENVSVDKLKEISDQIKNHPLRFFKVHVVNVKKARAYYDRDVCAKLYWKLRTYTYKANVINNDIENNIIDIELYDLKNNNIFEKAHIKEFLE